MPTLRFTPNIQRHVNCEETVVEGSTVRLCLEHYFSYNSQARSYILDDQGALRKHMNIFINSEQVTDRKGLTDSVGEADELYIIQALSGGN